MLKKYLSFALVALVLNPAFGATVFASTTKEEKAQKFVAKVKNNIAKLGTGKDAQVSVKLKDGTKLKGFVSEASETGFVVTDAKTGTLTNIAYSAAKQVKGNNLSAAAIVLISLGAFIGFVAIFSD